MQQYNTQAASINNKSEIENTFSGGACVGVFYAALDS